MQKSESIKELAKALSNAQGTLKPATKNKENPFHKSSYADLESTWDACRESLCKNGLSVSQLLDSSEDGSAALTTILMHTSGEFISSTIKLPLTKGGPQETGSCVTYIRRYSLQSIIGIATVDDDAEAAEHVTRATLQSTTVKNYAPAATKSVTTEQVNLSDVASYVATFGKYKGIALQDIAPYELANYVSYLESTAQKDGKPLKGATLTFVQAAQAWLKTKAEVPAALNGAAEIVDSFDALN